MTVSNVQWILQTHIPVGPFRTTGTRSTTPSAAVTPTSERLIPRLPPWFHGQTRPDEADARGIGNATKSPTDSLDRSRRITTRPQFLLLAFCHDSDAVFGEQRYRPTSGDGSPRHAGRRLPRREREVEKDGPPRNRWPRYVQRSASGGLVWFGPREDWVRVASDMRMRLVAWSPGGG